MNGAPRRSPQAQMCAHQRSRSSASGHAWREHAGMLAIEKAKASQDLALASQHILRCSSPP